MIGEAEIDEPRLDKAGLGVDGSEGTFSIVNAAYGLLVLAGR